MLLLPPTANIASLLLGYLLVGLGLFVVSARKFRVSLAYAASAVSISFLIALYLLIAWGSDGMEEARHTNPVLVLTPLFLLSIVVSAGGIPARKTIMPSDSS